MVSAEPRAKLFPELTNISGGCINECYLLKTAGRKYFLKVNSAAKYPGMFQAEFKGLQLLRKANSFVVPEPLITCENEKLQFLLLEFIETGSVNNYWYEAGKTLARQHSCSAEKFGLDFENYIGSLPQQNSYTDNFYEFFILRRIEPMLKMAIDRGSAEQNIAKNFENLFSRLHDNIPVEKPALLHGDLWSGNIMCSAMGPVVYDPAVYYGHREADIAMTKLFGGFGDEFYNGYNNEFPLAKGWEQRIEIFNLYPLLVHVILFGGSYYQEVKQIIKRF